MQVEFTEVLQSLATLGIGSVISAVILAIINRRQLKADAAKTGAEGANVFVDTGIDLVVQIRTELGHALNELRTLRAEREAKERADRAQVIRLETHSRWDRKVRAQYPDLEPCPPLWPDE